LKNELFWPDFDVMGGDCNPTSVYRSLQVAKASLLLEEHVLDGRLPVTSLVLLTHIAVRVREYSRTAPLDARLSQRDERITSKLTPQAEQNDKIALEISYTTQNSNLLH
jgi:hypothetical protein